MLIVKYFRATSQMCWVQSTQTTVPTTRDRLALAEEPTPSACVA